MNLKSQPNIFDLNSPPALDRDTRTCPKTVVVIFQSIPSIKEDVFFGLVKGFEKELGYFSLSELESVNGPMGLPIERDLYWNPRSLNEIAPELFKV